MAVETRKADAASHLAALNVAALIDHILSSYHKIHRQELPDLLALARKVERVHHDVPKGACGSWHRLYAGVKKLGDGIREHIRVENEVLFPRFELAAGPRCICAHG